MGWLDKAKSLLGMTGQSPEGPSADPKAPTGTVGARSHRGGPARPKDGRPPLPDVSGAASATLEDALAARERGAHGEARAILVAIDKGRGLRTVLRAAAALEADDMDELAELLPTVAREEPPWQLPLQVAAALPPGSDTSHLVARAKERGAPGWALAWVRAVGAEEAERRAGLVDLLFEDPALARTIASRDLGIRDVKPDNEGVRRYTTFAHGRDTIRRFGTNIVAATAERAWTETGKVARS